MHTVELLEVALNAARSAGYRVRTEWLAGCSGACEIKGQKWLFLDLALSPAEQLELVVEALRREPAFEQFQPGRLAEEAPYRRDAA